MNETLKQWTVIAGLIGVCLLAILGEITAIAFILVLITEGECSGIGE